jgi:hypothetical protein
VPVPGRHDSIAHNKIRIVDCSRNPQHPEATGRKIGDRVEISDLAIHKKKRVNGAVVGGREPNDFSTSIATERAIWISRCGIDHRCTAECSEIVHFPIIEKGMTRTVGYERKAADPSGRIDGVGRAGGPTKCSQIDRVVGELRHGAVQCDEKNQECSQRDFGFWVHEKESALVRAGG